ncbi:unnamed protein product [Rotaria sp. Silwood1]|nr:unnamed protein product [Rotaria sp. Silwood1]
MKQLFGRPNMANRSHESDANHAITIFLPQENSEHSAAREKFDFVQVFQTESAILEYSINKQTTSMWLRFYNWFTLKFRTFLERDDFQIDPLDLHKHIDFQQFLQRSLSDPARYQNAMQMIDEAEQTHGLPRYRRQLNFPNNKVLSAQERASWASNPSGSIVGTYYYGVGSDPNYGSFIKPQNRPDVGIVPISYDPDSSLSSYLINPNHPTALQQSVQQYFYNNNNNNNHVWQRPNNYANRPYNYYSPGSQGWYATGGNYWYNRGQSLPQQSCLLVLSILSLIIFCE